MSPSSNRAQKVMIQAPLHSACPLPALKPRSSDTRAGRASSILPHRIGAPREEFAIPREVEVTTKLQDQPRRPHRPEARMDYIDGHGVTPQLRVVIYGESSRAIEIPGQLPAVFARVVDQIEQRL